MKEIANVKAAGGRQIRFQHASQVCDCEMTCSLFLPPAAERAAVPALYWLSGVTSTDENFAVKAGAQQWAAACGIALVMPDTSPRGDAVPSSSDGNEWLGHGAGFYLSATQKPWAQNYHMYDYVLNELPATVEGAFAIDGDLRSIGGYSMGGHGALVIALRNPDRYCSVSALAPIVSPPESPVVRQAFAEYLGDDQEAWAGFDACALIRRGADKKFDLLVDQGTDDVYMDEHLKPELLRAACAESGYPLYFNYREGYGHNYHFVSDFIGAHIRFHKHQLRRRRA